MSQESTQSLATAQEADLEKSYEVCPILPKGKIPNYSDDQHGKDSKEIHDEVESHALLVPSTEKHFPFLDITRIICVAVVCVDHGDYHYGLVNYYFCQSWALQYLFLVSGIALGMSKKSLGGYVLRLSTYVVIGIALNWIAYIVAGLDWKRNFVDVIFHLWFVIAVIVYSVILNPLKPFLLRLQCRAREEALEVGSAEGPAQDPRPRWAIEAIAYIFGGIVAIRLIFKFVCGPLLAIVLSSFVNKSLAETLGPWAEHWGLPQDAAGISVFVDRFCEYPVLSLTNLYLLFICPTLFARVPIVSWILILNTVVTRSLFYRGGEERMFHGFDIVMLGLVCFCTGLLHRRKICDFLMRYWFMVLFALALCWPPGLTGRLDENPPVQISLRTSVAVMEGIFLVFWLVAADRIFQKEIFTEDRLDWLNNAALLAFLVHKAIHIAVPQPASWFLLVAIVPFSYMFHGTTKK